MANGKQTGQAEARVDGLDKPRGMSAICPALFTFDMNTVTDALLHVETWNSCWASQLSEAGQISEKTPSETSVLAPTGGLCLTPDTEWAVEVWWSADCCSGVIQEQPPQLFTCHFNLNWCFCVGHGDKFVWGLLRFFLSHSSNLHIDNPPSVDFIKIWSMLWTYE